MNNRVREQGQPEAVFLIGYPGSGKSTYLEKFFAMQHDLPYEVISSDNLIYELAQRDGTTYAAAHAKYFEDIVPGLIARTDAAVASNHSIIFDQTNLDPIVRASKLAQIASHYHKKAIVFEVDVETLIARQHAPERMAIGKVIPREVFENMQAVYRKPDLTEFDEIVIITM